MSECLFCNIVDKKFPTEIINESKNTVAFRDINPQAPVHILIIPKAHISTLNDVSDKQQNILGELQFVARDLAAAEGIANSGYRTVINCNEHGGQAVYHVHLHLLGGRKMTWPPG